MVKKTKKVKVSFRIEVKGYVGGTFELDKAKYDELREKFEDSPRGYDAEVLAEQVMDLSKIDLRFLNVDDMELEEFDEETDR